MTFDIFVVGPLAANCFIVGCDSTNQVAIIDPGDEAQLIIDFVKQKNLDVKYILLTHGHIDHLAAVQKLKETLNVEFLMHEEDQFLIQRAVDQAAMFGISDPGKPKPDKYLKHGDIVTLGKLELKVLHTPGHSPGSITFSTEDKLIVGDLIFSGSIGRTDLPGGDYNQLIQSVKTNIFTFPDTTEIYPGHGPKTTVGIEKAGNPFFQ